ncbi:MAG TPA: hypothetical protein VFH47_09305 [Candidatus Thermoplasmatota archaeon]|nr:hypothetical protein [Candidatus Thermoplasmatota archaeon]
MPNEELAKRLIKILNELEERFKQGTVGVKEMQALVEREKIPHLDGYLRRSGALDYQSPKRFYQAGPDLAAVREQLKKGKIPRGLEGLLGTLS